MVVLATASNGIFLKLETAKTLLVKKMTFVNEKNTIKNPIINAVSYNLPNDCSKNRSRNKIWLKIKKTACGRINSIMREFTLKDMIQRNAQKVIAEYMAAKMRELFKNG